MHWIPAREDDGRGAFKFIGVYDDCLIHKLSFIDVPEKLYIHGILAVYELNQIDLLRDMFVWADERSAARYRIILVEY